MRALRPTERPILVTTNPTASTLVTAQKTVLLTTETILVCDNLYSRFIYTDTFTTVAKSIAAVQTM